MARTVSPSSSKPAAPARDAGGIAGALAELLALGNTRGWVVTCYQKLEPNDLIVLGGNKLQYMGGQLKIGLTGDDVTVRLPLA